MSQTNVSYYCRTKNPPRAHVVEHMARKLEVSVWKLMDEPRFHEASNSSPVSNSTPIFFMFSISCLRMVRGRRNSGMP